MSVEQKYKLDVEESFVDIYRETALMFTSQTSFKHLSGVLLNLLRGLDYVEGADLYELHNPEHKNESHRQRFEKLNAFIFRSDLNYFDVISNEVELSFLKDAIFNSNRNNQNSKIIISLSVRTSIRRYLFIDLQKDSIDNGEYIDYVINIYQNMASLIEKNEQDKLTGLLNRETYDEQIFNIIKSVPKNTNEQYSTHSWLAVLDIDHFKQINDQYGHLFGDEILLLFSQLMQNTFRYHDLLFRYGGEEFVVVLNNLNHDRVLTALERFRCNISEFEFPIDRKITVSIGLAKIEASMLPSTLFDNADKALYKAKESGRNQIICADTLIDTDSSVADVELF